MFATILEANCSQKYFFSRFKDTLFQQFFSPNYFLPVICHHLAIFKLVLILFVLWKSRKSAFLILCVYKNRVTSNPFWFQLIVYKTARSDKQRGTKTACYWQKLRSLLPELNFGTQNRNIGSIISTVPKFTGVMLPVQIFEISDIQMAGL